MAKNNHKKLATNKLRQITVIPCDAVMKIKAFLTELCVFGTLSDCSKVLFSNELYRMYKCAMIANQSEKARRLQARQEVTLVNAVTERDYFWF